MATHAEFADHIGVSRQAVSEMVRKEIIPSTGRGKIDLNEARLAYCAHLREQAAGRRGSGDGGLDLTEERARKEKEQADHLEMKNAELRRELLQREDVAAAVVGSFARVRARLIGVPSKAAPMVMGLETPAEAEAVIRNAVYDALRELSETTVADLCGDDDGMVEDTGAAAGPDGEPVGGQPEEAEP